MRNLNILAIFCSFLFVLGLASCKEESTPTTPAPTDYVADDNSFTSFMSWKLEKTNMGPSPSLGMAHAGNDSTVVRKIYFKDGQNSVNGKYPIGTIIVKHSDNSNGTLKEYVAMVKRGNDFNKTGGNWEWFMLMPDGKIGSDNGMPMRGAGLMGGMCGSCHNAASSKDFVFSK